LAGSDGALIEVLTWRLVEELRKITKKNSVKIAVFRSRFQLGIFPYITYLIHAMNSVKSLKSHVSVGALKETDTTLLSLII
jgi:hypothetical protein